MELSSLFLKDFTGLTNAIYFVALIRCIEFSQVMKKLK